MVLVHVLAISFFEEDKRRIRDTLIVPVVKYKILPLEETAIRELFQVPLNPTI